MARHNVAQYQSRKDNSRPELEEPGKLSRRLLSRFFPPPLSLPLLQQASSQLAITQLATSAWTFLHSTLLGALCRRAAALVSSKKRSAAPQQFALAALLAAKRGAGALFTGQKAALALAAKMGELGRDKNANQEKLSAYFGSYKMARRDALCKKALA